MHAHGPDKHYGKEIERNACLNTLFYGSISSSSITKQLKNRKRKMFNKLISNLPFNPSLIHQVSFYSRRLRKETAIRRMGFGFVALTFFVQMFAVIAPPEASFAKPPNDVIPNGFSSQGEAVNHCNADNYDFKKILNHFQINCEDLYFGKVETISTRAYNGNLYSMGRLPYSKPGETAVDVDGAGRLYMRPLTSVMRSSTTKVVSGKTASGVTFFVMFDCGNLILVGPPVKPTPPPPPPPPPPTPVRVIACGDLTMSVANGTTVKSGSTISVQGRAIGRNLPPNDSVSMYYELTNKDTGARVGFLQEAQGVPFENELATDTTPRTFRIDNEGNYEFKLFVKYDSSSKDALFNGLNRCAKQITVKTTDVCPEVPGEQTSTEECYVCPEGEDDSFCLTLSKKAANDTQNIPDANGTVAKPGDTVTYTLQVENKNPREFKDFVVEEPVSDILEYADITDLHGGTLEKIDGVSVVTWPAANIAANGKLEQQLTIRIKNPLPKTNTPSSDPSSFDMQLTNVYGNQVTIKLPPNVPKTTEQVVTTLPNTGPAENIAIGTLLTIFVGYFFARSRLMKKELDIVRTEFDTGGIA
jgi:uncharacterized repeat protein (TIGR01451 family)